MITRDGLLFLIHVSEIKPALSISNCDLKLFSKTWEDNQNCIKVSKSPKFTPRTIYIALECHHFRHFVPDGIIAIEYINTAEQTAGIFKNHCPRKHYIISGRS